MIAPQHSRAVQVHPGLTSWDIFSRPYGTGLGGNVNPGLTSWATLSRPFGTQFVSRVLTQGFKAAKNAKDGHPSIAPISCTQLWTGPRVRLSFKERRMKCREPRRLHRKSGLPRFPVRSSGQDHVCAFLLRKGA
jgi:hypothetical protein